MRVRLELVFGNIVVVDTADSQEIVRVVYGASQLKIKSNSHFLHISPEVNAYVGGKLVEDKCFIEHRNRRVGEYGRVAVSALRASG